MNEKEELERLNKYLQNQKETQEKKELKRKNPLEFYHEQCNELEELAGKLHYKKLEEKNEYDGRYDTLLEDINEFFDIDLSNITSKIQGFKSGKDRYIELTHNQQTSALPYESSEVFKEFIQSIREKQYHSLSSQARLLKVRAKGFLHMDNPDDLFDEFTTKIMKHKIKEKEKNMTTKRR